MRYARLRATSPTYGAVTLIDCRGARGGSVLRDVSGDGHQRAAAHPGVEAAHWIEYCFRTLKHLLATGACQVHSEDAYYGHLVLRLMGCFVLFYTSRVVCKGRLTMEEIIFSLKHYWRFVDSEALEFTSTFIGGRRESRMNTSRTQRSEKSAECDTVSSKAPSRAKCVTLPGPKMSGNLSSCSRAPRAAR